MTDSGSEANDEFASAAERDLHSKLGLVRADEPSPGSALVPAIARTLRWQRLLITPLTLVSSVVGGLLGAFKAISPPRGDGR